MASTAQISNSKARQKKQVKLIWQTVAYLHVQQLQKQNYHSFWFLSSPEGNIFLTSKSYLWFLSLCCWSGSVQWIFRASLLKTIYAPLKSWKKLQKWVLILSLVHHQKQTLSEGSFSHYQLMHCYYQTQLQLLYIFVFSIHYFVAEVVEISNFSFRLYQLCPPDWGYFVPCFSPQQIGWGKSVNCALHWDQF